MGVSVGVRRDDIPDWAGGNEPAELAVGLIPAEQHREGVGEQLGVLAFSCAEKVRLRPAWQEARPRGARAICHIFKAHIILLCNVAFPYLDCVQLITHCGQPVYPSARYVDAARD